MTTLVGRLRDIQDTLDALARRHRVPGATLAIAQGDEVLDFATGVLNVNTGVKTTTDSVFQIGSNTKLFTTTLVMQLVDAGQVDLDQPVRRYLPRAPSPAGATRFQKRPGTHPAACLVSH